MLSFQIREVLRRQSPATYSKSPKIAALAGTWRGCNKILQVSVSSSYSQSSSFQVQQESERTFSFSSPRNNSRPEIYSGGYVGDKLTAVEKAFSSLLIDSICESLEHALGPDVLQILASKGLLDNSDSPEKFEGQLRSIFFDGAKVLERLIIKDLYRKLGIP